MNQNRLEIKITKDTDEKDVNLKAMSLKAAQSFLVLFESITKIVELTQGHKDIKIQITSGSAVIAAEGETIAKAKKEFDKIVENKSKNKELIEQWRRIQTVFAANGLQYEANFYDHNMQKAPFYDLLRNRQKLRAKPVAPKRFKTELEFITGKLIAVGGKHPNIHVEVDGKALPPIACTELSATKANAYLYQTIRFSVWAKEAAGIKRYILCDSYAKESTLEELQRIIAELVATDQIESLKKIHYLCRNYLDRQDYAGLRRFIRLFIHDSTDINILKMILIVTQSVSQHERLKLMIDDLRNVFDQKFKMLNKNPKR